MAGTTNGICTIGSQVRWFTAHSLSSVTRFFSGARDVPKEVDSPVLRDIIAFAKDSDIRQSSLIDPKKKRWPTEKTFYASKPSIAYNQRDDMIVMWHPKQQHPYEDTLPIDEEQVEADRLKREGALKVYIA